MTRKERFRKTIAQKGESTLRPPKIVVTKTKIPTWFGRSLKGENTLKVTHFSPKKVMYNKYYDTQ